MAILGDNTVRRPRDLVAAFVKELPVLIPGLKITASSRQANRPENSPDIEADVATPVGSKRRIVIEVKASLSPGRIRESLLQVKAYASGKTKGYPVLAAGYLTPNVRQICREEGVGYVDRAGNCLVNLDGLYIDKSVDKNPFPARGRPGSIFTPVSSRLLRVMLEEPKQTWELSALSTTADVSRSFAYKVIQRLLREGYAEKKGLKYKLLEPGKLLDDWRDQYDPGKSELYSYYSFERDTGKLIKMIARSAREKSLWYAFTSFSAASLVAPFVRGIGTVRFYVPDIATCDGWIRMLDLRPVESGPNVVIMIPYDQGVFYRKWKVDGITLVGNIQLYLDLYSDPARGKEQAEFLRKEKMRF